MSAPSRIRLAAACALLVGLSLVQSPGFLTSDTKLDLVGDPGGFLTRAAHLWDGQGALGQLQNQAYGYLWPMGPFFWLGDQLGAPGWVVQRSWWALVLCVAFVGASLLARALGVRTDLATLAVGATYALSPRMLTVLGPISIEAWPMALAPWVLLPLVLGSRAGSPRLAAALSALAVAMVGGVNAAATFAVLPLGVVWLLTRESGPRRRSLMIWWPVLTALATAWWLAPLFLLGAYSPPFLDFIETAAVTTFPTTVFDTLRGTSNWVPYLDPGSRSGWELLTTSALVLNGGILLVVGLAGLLHPGTPHRRFLGLGVMTGVLMVTAGHAGAVEGWWASYVRSALDGVLAPLRNVHKFDPVLRLPLAIGVGLALDRFVTRPARPGPDGSSALERVNARAVLATVLVALVTTSLPALQGRIAPAGVYLGTPAYWTQAADWLAERSGDQATMLAPGSTFGEYLWGEPRDEPMQWLAGSRWAVRNVVPLAPAGNVRMLDAVEARLAQGEGSPGLGDFLARAGIEYVLVRNDLARSDDVPDPVLVHQAISETPGLGLVASFGPEVGGGASLRRDDTRVVINGGWQSTYPALEIYEVNEGEVSAAVSTAAPVVVAGGPEDLLDLADLDLVGAQPSLLATDLAEAPAPDSPVVLSDGLRERERMFARIHDGVSPVLTPGDVRRTSNPTSDYRIGDAERWSTRATLVGAAAVSASSSRSDAGALGGSNRGRLPYAAVDGDDGTQWVAGSSADPGWWQLDLETPSAVTEVRLLGGTRADAGQQVRIRVGDFQSDPLDLGPGRAVVVQVPTGSGEASAVRVEDARDASASLSIAEVDVEVDGAAVDVARSLVVPALPPDWGAPDALALRADLDDRRGCASLEQEVRCRTGSTPASEEPDGLDRMVDLGPGSHRWSTELRVRPRANRALDRLALRGQPASVVASSVGVGDPRASALSAIDGDPGTSWQARLSDLRPVLSLAWLGVEPVRGIDLRVRPGQAVRAPTVVELRWPDGRRRVVLDEGRADFPTIRTDQLEIRTLQAEPAEGLDFDTQVSALPVGIGEVRLAGVPYLPLGLSADVRRLGCGTGPDLAVDGIPRATALVTSPAVLHLGRAVPAELCADDALSLGGEHRISFERSAAVTGASVVLRRSDGLLSTDAAAVATPSATSLHDATPEGGVVVDAVTRRLQPADGDTLVVLRENVNAGWEATQDGTVLDPVTVDGWQQAWRISPGGGEVLVSFAPDRVYRTGLGVGLLALLSLVLVVGVALLRRRRASGDTPASCEQERPMSVVPLGLLAGITAGLVAGWVGLLVGALAAVGVWLLRGQVGTAAWVLAVPALLAALAYAVTPWGSAQGWAGTQAWTSYVCVVPVVALLLAGARRPGRVAWPIRRAGRSTSR